MHAHALHCQDALTHKPTDASQRSLPIRRLSSVPQLSLLDFGCQILVLMHMRLAPGSALLAGDSCQELRLPISAWSSDGKDWRSGSETGEAQQKRVPATDSPQPRALFMVYKALSVHYGLYSVEPPV